MIWYIWCDWCGDMIDIWYGVIDKRLIYHMIDMLKWYDIYDTMYDMIYLLAAIGLKI
jgi:hypothetical protein